jgi:hypothetical protein
MPLPFVPRALRPLRLPPQSLPLETVRGTESETSSATRRDDETGGVAVRDIGGYHLVFEFSGPDRYFSEVGHVPLNGRTE